MLHCDTVGSNVAVMRQLFYRIIPQLGFVGYSADKLNNVPIPRLGFIMQEARLWTYSILSLTSCLEPQQT